MAFMARVKELGKVFTEVDENEFNINGNDLEESAVNEIIMIHPELLKALANLGKPEKDVEMGIADTNNASPKKKESGDFKRSLDAMTEILGKNKEESTARKRKLTGNGQKEIMD